MEILTRKLEQDEQVFEIESEDGATIELTGNHIIPIIRNSQRIEIRVDELLETDYIFNF